MTTLHEARIERAARLVAEAEKSLAAAWDKAQSAEAAWLAATDASAVARHDAWVSEAVLDAARAAQAKAISEGE